jgi:bifunctional enzyme CysN/CysC
MADLPATRHPPAEATAGRPTRVVFVGHVDHGKSTVIGRLLHDTDNLPDGSAAAAIAASQRRGGRIEWSFVLDSLQAERDQGVTIDATRLPFALAGRPYEIVDAPGHRQFLRNMVTGAADADAAVLVVDAAEGVRAQTRRHAAMLAMIGIRHVIVLLNKADQLDFDQARLGAAAASVTAALAGLEITPRAVIPAAAREGDNIAQASARMPWHAGPTLAEALRGIGQPPGADSQGLRLPVQDVYRDGEQRVVVGRIERGGLRVGDEVAIGAPGTRARVARLLAWQATPPARAVAGQSVAIVLAPDVVVERGDLIYPPDDPPMRAARLRARLFWLRAEPLRVGESFSLRLATAEHPVTVASIDSVRQLDPGAPAAADQVPPEGFAEVTLHAPQGVLFDPFVPGGAGGRGVLADAWQRIVGGAPLLGPATSTAATQVFPPDSALSLRDRAQANGHYGAVFWMTGLPGAGKSTIARLAEALLFGRGMQVAVLDGDTLRARLNSDLGFSESDRTENIRRTAAVARLMADHGLVVLTSLISPTAAHRALARTLIGERYAEVYVNADLATCEARDPKGLYAAARAGKLPGFTGIGAPYEPPDAPDIVLDTTQQPPEASAAQLAALIEARVRLPGRGRAPA